MSKSAHRAISECDCVAGYSTYIKLLGSMVEGKELIVSGMTREIDRAVAAIKKALEGKSVCMISSGDPGVYGMAGVVLELLQKNESGRIELEIIPGIISATACAALLGAPLMNDFAAISLSDLMTGWEQIEKRISAAAGTDFVIVLYNPKSKARTKPFARALDIIRNYRPAGTPVGIVRNAYRRCETAKVVCLKDVQSIRNIDMVTTIIIGNSCTYVKNGYMITPRGYNYKKTAEI